MSRNAFIQIRVLNLIISNQEFPSNLGIFCLNLLEQQTWRFSCRYSFKENRNGRLDFNTRIKLNGRRGDCRSRVSLKERERCSRKVQEEAVQLDRFNATLYSLSCKGITDLSTIAEALFRARFRSAMSTSSGGLQRARRTFNLPPSLESTSCVRTLRKKRRDGSTPSRHPTPPPPYRHIS
jgi:hypothetical protein